MQSKKKDRKRAHIFFLYQVGLENHDSKIAIWSINTVVTIDN